MVNKYGHYFKVSWKDINKARKYFSAGPTDEISLFIARALPIWPIEIVSIFCGFIQMSWQKFVTYSFLGFSF